MQVADRIALWLADNDITHAFGIVGAGNVALYDAIHRLGETKIVACHHEQAAAMAATYYYRTSNRLALTLVTTGAGSTNAITGVAAAFMDSIPVIVISGNEPKKFFGLPHPRVIGVQGYDSVDLARTTTKRAVQIKHAKDAIPLLDICREASLSPRQGPVWVDIPRDIQVEKI